MLKIGSYPTNLMIKPDHNHSTSTRIIHFKLVSGKADLGGPFSNGGNQMTYHQLSAVSGRF